MLFLNYVNKITCMSKKRNTGITDKLAIRYTCYVATATPNLEDLGNSSLWTCLHNMDI